MASRVQTRGTVMGLMVAVLAAAIALAGPGSARPLWLPPTAVAAATTTPTPAATSAPSATPTRVPAATASPSATPTSTPEPTPAPAAQPGVVIGRSAGGHPIVAYRIGRGPLKIALIGDIHGGYEANTFALARKLLTHYQAHPGAVPAEVSLWIVPVMNPDGLLAGRRGNANDVDLNRNADTDLDGCGGNDWSPDAAGPDGTQPGSGGAYPFSEPEARAMRDFLSDAWIAVFYHSSAEAIFADTCDLHLPTARLADVLSKATGYPVEDWIGYPLTGEFGDYLAGEGVAAVTVELADHEDPEYERNLAGVEAVLAAAGDIVAAEAGEAQAPLTWLSTGEDGNTRARRYTAGSFPHPIAVEVIGDTVYVLDGGRVLAAGLDGAEAPRLLLAPGDTIPAQGKGTGTRVLEPLDLTAGGPSLLVLDRAGDVYRYDPAGDAWTVVRPDRAVRDTYDHYYVALAGAEAGQYLMETTHERIWRFEPGQKGAVWAALPQGRDVDLAAAGSDVYVLTREMNKPGGTLARLRDGQPAADFRPNLAVIHPRQVQAAADAVYVLDRAGRRLLALDPGNGRARAVYQFRDRRAVSALWAGESGRVVLAGRDALYFPGEAGADVTVEGGPVLLGPQPHDPASVDAVAGLRVPIDGARITSRDFQLPGAPRHYRLGVHEGMDFYGHTVGVPVGRNTPVHAVADGVVIRAMLDYQDLTPVKAAAYEAEWQRLGYTPPDVLDGYRGRQVWIQHADGLVSRYAHLGSIEPGIAEGSRVTRGQVIAHVGNSGTPDSLNGPNSDVHLHLELWLGDHFVGQFLRPIEAREWIERILR